MIDYPIECDNVERIDKDGDIYKLALNYMTDVAAGAVNPKSAAAILSREVIRLTEKLVFAAMSPQPTASVVECARAIERECIKVFSNEYEGFSEKEESIAMPKTPAMEASTPQPLPVERNPLELEQCDNLLDVEIWLQEQDTSDCRSRALDRAEQIVSEKYNSKLALLDDMLRHTHYALASTKYTLINVSHFLSKGGLIEGLSPHNTACKVAIVQEALDRNDEKLKTIGNYTMNAQQTESAKRLDREVENHNVRACYEVASRSMCPDTWDKFCDALNELCERRGMDNAFMGANAKPRTWELR